jgi:large subunit ribosomal protein L15
MDLGHLQKPKKSTKQRKRVGRGPGCGNGKTSGRGHKGIQARAGSRRRYAKEGGQMPLHRRLPKRGFRAFDPTEYQIVNISQLATKFQAAAGVGPSEMKAAGLISSLNKPVKILGSGEISVPCTVQAQAFSESARKKLEAAGGKVEIL